MDSPISSPSFADELEERLINFAVRVVRLSGRLPRSTAGRHIASQILRSGTSAAANYGEARGAESRADFIHKVRIVLKELNETSIWLRILERAEIMKAGLLRNLLYETKELCKIFTTTLNTSRAKHTMTNVKSPMSNVK